MVDYLTILGPRLIQPMADILEKLLSFPRSENKQKLTPDESGYSVLICLLTAVIVESFVMRVRYLNYSEETESVRSLHKFLDEKYPMFDLTQELIEIFILRDVIAHNHIWEITSSGDSNIWLETQMKNMHPLTSNRKDKKYNNAVNIKSARTKISKLHVIPTQINITDVSKVLRIARDTLIFLEEQEGQILGVYATQAIFRESMVSLPELYEKAIKIIEKTYYGNTVI